MKKGHIYLILTALCCSIAGLLIRNTQAEGIVISTYAALIAIPASLLLYRRGISLTPMIVLTGLIQFAMSLTYVYATQKTSVANAIVLQYTSGVFVLVYQSLEERRLPSMRYVGIMISVLIGLIIFVFEGLSAGHIVGNLLGLLSGALLGLAFHLTAKPDIDAFSVCIVAYASSTLVGLLRLHHFPNITVNSWLSIAAYGLFVYAISGITYSIGIETTDAFTANLLCMMEIILAPLWTFLLFHETITLLSLIGAIIIVASLIVLLWIEQRSQT